eukprot:jgi/Orpsp1_1/1183114/evm.model.c7180000083942.1
MNANPSSKSKIENHPVRKISHPLIQKTSNQSLSSIPSNEQQDSKDLNRSSMMENMEIQNQTVNGIQENNKKGKGKENIEELKKQIIHGSENAQEIIKQGIH